MAKPTSIQIAFAYLERFPDEVIISKEAITIHTNHAQVIRSLFHTALILLPAIGIWQINGFRSGIGLAICIIAQLLFIWQTYRFLRGHNELIIHTRDRYVESRNTVFMYKLFFRNKRIAFDEIKEVLIRKKQETNIEDRDSITIWDQLTILTKEGDKTIFMDFEKDKRFAGYIKDILDGLTNP
jgi:hypothetical protein